MLQFWFPKNEFFKYLQPMMGYSEFCRKWILTGIEKEFNEEFADQQYKFHMEKAKEWKEKKTNLQENTNKVNKILKDAINYYKDVSRDPTISELNISRYIKSQILPKLQSAHCNRFNV